MSAKIERVPEHPVVDEIAIPVSLKKADIDQIANERLAIIDGNPVIERAARPEAKDRRENQGVFVRLERDAVAPYVRKVLGDAPPATVPLVSTPENEALALLVLRRVGVVREERHGLTSGLKLLPTRHVTPPNNLPRRIRRLVARAGAIRPKCSAPIRGSWSRSPDP